MKKIAAICSASLLGVTCLSGTANAAFDRKIGETGILQFVKTAVQVETQPSCEFTMPDEQAFTHMEDEGTHNFVFRDHTNPARVKVNAVGIGAIKISSSGEVNETSALGSESIFPAERLQVQVLQELAENPFGGADKSWTFSRNLNHLSTMTLDEKATGEFDIAIASFDVQMGSAYAYDATNTTRITLEFQCYSD
jgi:hypothetical protein